MNKELTRRDFLRNAGKVTLGAAALTTIPVSMASAEETLD